MTKESKKHPYLHHNIPVLSPKEVAQLLLKYEKPNSKPKKTSENIKEISQ